jgi:hypothetical protein
MCEAVQLGDLPTPSRPWGGGLAYRAVGVSVTVTSGGSCWCWGQVRTQIRQGIAKYAAWGLRVSTQFKNLYDTRDKIRRFSRTSCVQLPKLLVSNTCGGSSSTWSFEVGHLTATSVTARDGCGDMAQWLISMWSD